MKLLVIGKGRLTQCCLVALFMTVPSPGLSVPGNSESEQLNHSMATHLSQNFRSTRSLSELSSGMQINSVIRIWGPALRKQEYESKRLLRWYYPDDVVLTFADGGLVEFTSAQEVRTVNLNAKREPEELPGLIPDKVPSALTDDLLSEILREVPSEPDVPSSGELDVNAAPIEVKPKKR